MSWLIHPMIYRMTLNRLQNMMVRRKTHNFASKGENQTREHEFLSKIIVSIPLIAMYRNFCFTSICTLTLSFIFLFAILRPTIRLLAITFKVIVYFGWNNHGIHQIYGSELLFFTLAGIKHRPSWTRVGYSNHSTKALTFFWVYLYQISLYQDLKLPPLSLNKII